MKSFLLRLCKHFVKPGQAFLTEKWLFQPQVLFFHGIEEELFDERIQKMQIRLSDFEILVRYLKKHFCLIDLNEYQQRLTAKDGDLSRCVMLTFDDGYESNHRLLAPFLRSLDVPFTIYLTTSCIGTGDRIPTFTARAGIHLTEKTELRLPDQTLPLKTEDQRNLAISNAIRLLKTRSAVEVRELVFILKELLPDSRWADVEGLFSSDAFMTWDQVKELHQQGVVIGAHGHEHVPLHDHLEADEIPRQILLSRDAIVNRLGVCHHYAYPNGNPEDISSRAVEALASAGFQTAVTTFPATVAASRHPLLIPRICTYTIDRFQKFVLKDIVYRPGKKLQSWQSSMPGLITSTAL